MAKITSLPGQRTLTLPVARGATVRLTQLHDSTEVLFELRGPNGGDLGGLVLNADNARLVAEGLTRVADGCSPAAVGELGAADGWRQSAEPRPRLEADTTLAMFARLAVPVFADWCTVDLACGHGMPRRLSVIHADTSKRRAAETLARYPHDPRMAHPRSSVWQSGVPDLALDVPDSRVVAAARSAEHLAVLRALRCRSSLAVPIVAGGRVEGVITFALAESGRRYSEDDVALGVMLARCAALAAENARLYGHVHEALRPRLGTSPVRARRGPSRANGSGAPKRR
jgi:GAF domain-containing protein